MTALFRGTVEIPPGRKIVKATLMMAAEGRFICRVNGSKAAESSEFLTVQITDVTADLKPGGNVLAVESVLPTRERWSNGNRAGVVGAVRIEYAEGAPQTALTDGNWKVAQRKEEGWQRTGFNDASWKSVQTWSWKGTGVSPWSLFDRAMPGDSGTTNCEK